MVERLAYREAGGREVVVVSSDTVVRHVAQRGGVQAMSAREFLDRVAASAGGTERSPEGRIRHRWASLSTRLCARRSSVSAAESELQASSGFSLDTGRRLGTVPTLNLKLNLMVRSSWLRFSALDPEPPGGHGGQCKRSSCSKQPAGVPRTG